MMAGRPSHIGGYRVLDVIGRGGFASVHRCLDERLGAEVAIKVLADNHSIEPRIRERFLSEGRLLRSIDNRHLIQVYDVGETDRGQPFLVLELADGGDLATRVDRLRSTGWKATPADVRVVANAVGAALTALHHGNLVHRDLSPSNLLIRRTSDSAANRPAATIIDADERLIVADLGLAKDLSINSGLTVAAGTERFSAPEQRAVNTIDRRADIYALAKILEWLIAGGEGREPAWADRLRQVLATALATDPGQRPGTATELVDAIDAVLVPEDPGVPEGPAVLEDPGFGGLQGRNAGAQRRWFPFRVAAGAGVVAVLVLVVGLWWPSRSDDAVHRVLDDGRVAVSLVDFGMSTEIVGPDVLHVGSTATYETAVSGHESFRWIMPDGTEYADVAAVEVEGVEPGTSQLRVRATSSAGDTSELRFPFTVRDSP